MLKKMLSFLLLLSVGGAGCRWRRDSFKNVSSKHKGSKILPAYISLSLSPVNPRLSIQKQFLIREGGSEVGGRGGGRKRRGLVDGRQISQPGTR